MAEGRVIRSRRLAQSERFCFKLSDDAQFFYVLLIGILDINGTCKTNASFIKSNIWALFDDTDKKNRSVAAVRGYI